VGRVSQTRGGAAEWEARAAEGASAVSGRPVQGCPNRSLHSLGARLAAASAQPGSRDARRCVCMCVHGRDAVLHGGCLTDRKGFGSDPTKKVAPAQRFPRPAPPEERTPPGLERQRPARLRRCAACSLAALRHLGDVHCLKKAGVNEAQARTQSAMPHVANAR
jgi:hypothetical protein